MRFARNKVPLSDLDRPVVRNQTCSERQRHDLGLPARNRGGSRASKRHSEEQVGQEDGDGEHPEPNRELERLKTRTDNLVLPSLYSLTGFDR